MTTTQGTGRHRAARQPRPLAVRVLWTVAGVLAAAIAAAVVLTATGRITHAVATTPVPAPCDWHGEMDTALARLGEDPANWTITEIAGGYAGQTDLDTLHALVDDDTPCTWVDSVVNHEWMHLQQGRVVGGTDATYAAYGGAAHLELVADCGSMLLGSRHTPYVDEHEDATGSGCSPDDLADARFLIALRPHVTLERAGTTS